MSGGVWACTQSVAECLVVCGHALRELLSVWWCVGMRSESC